MPTKILRFSVVLIMLVLTTTILGSCNKFKGDQTVPAYIRIDSISIYTDYEEQGAPTQNITDAWVYINNEAIGAYELPAVFPVLAKGLTEIRVDPGIKLNGIAALRSPYPFYEPIVQDVFLEEGKEICLNSDTLFMGNEYVLYTMSTTYYDNLVFVWMEDFEDPSLSLDSTSKSRANITRTYPVNHPDAFLADYSKYSGLMTLDSIGYLIEVATNVGNDQGFVLPQVGQPVFLEIDFKNDHYFTAGLYANEYSQIVQHPVVNMNPAAEWKKIYINLTPSVSSQVNAIDFNIFFGAIKDSDKEEGRMLIDNIKLIHRKQ
ncbi:MAG: hypothetical protein ABFS05_10950 [Bacteroidota bacterium]